MDRWAGCWVAVMLLVALVIGGCSSKKREADLAYGQPGSDLGEEALPGGGAGSLAQARAGTLGLEGAAAGPLSDIHFSYDSFDLDETARQVLQQNTDWLNRHLGARLEIEGHCDSRGTIEYNLALGAKRAAAAKSYLVALGVNGDRITTISYGEELPLCHEPVESCWRRNRRGHFVAVEN